MTEPARIDAFVRHLLDRNATMNLTGARSEAAVHEHVADSLTLRPWLREPFVDVGSGGGFPAIPLALATGYRGVLIECVGKKAAFLREVIAQLDLELEVVAERAEVAAHRPELRAGFASATARAVGSMPTLLELLIPLLAVDGLAILPRGAISAGERQATADAALVLGAEVVAEEGAPTGDGRRVLIVRKVAPTGPRFPRRVGIPTKRPLCFAEVERARA